MSRNKKVTIIVLIIALLIFGLFLFLEFGEQTTDPDQQPGDESPIFPFATTSGFFTSDDDSTNIVSPPTEPTEQPDLWKISDDPVAGSRWVSTDEDQEQIWFIKQENGYVFTANPETREINQLTDTQIPQVREAIIGPTGETVVYRYLDDNEVIQTYKAEIRPQANINFYEVSGSFLPTNIYDISMSPDGGRLFYLQESNNQSVGVLYNLTSDEQEQIFTSEVSDWRINFNQPEHITLFTPPADDVTGYAYELDAETGDKTKIGENTALAMKPNISGNEYIMSHQDDNSFKTKPNNPASSDTVVTTFIEKCSWANSEVYFCGVPTNVTPSSINTWYQGQQQFVDNLYIFNTSENNQDQLFSSGQIEKASADITDIIISDGFLYSAFTDKKTGDLWGYEL